MARSVRSAILLAAALLPLAVQAGAVVDLLDAARTAHPVALVELLVHGHTHGRKVATHAHAAPCGFDGAPRLDGPAETAGPASAAGAPGRAAPPVRAPLEAGRIAFSRPPKFLVHAALLR